MSNAFHDSLLKTPSSPAPPSPAVQTRVLAGQPLADALAAALTKQLKLLDGELVGARDGDSESVRTARGATRRIAVTLDAMKETAGVARTAKLRRRIAKLRRSLDRARRCDVLIDAGLDQHTDSVRRLAEQRTRAYAKLRERLDAHETQATLERLRRLAINRAEGESGLGVRDAAAALLRRSCEKVQAHADVAVAKPRGLKRLEKDIGRLLYTLELFADVLTEAGGPLRSDLAEAEASLAALRDAEMAFEREPTSGWRRRRDSLKGAIASDMSLLTGSKLRDEVEAAIGGP